jgi:hypothetical protein
MVLALSVNPGGHGLGRGARTVLPGDLLLQGVFGQAPLVPGIAEIRLGLAPSALDQLEGASGPLLRLGVESWIEHGDEVLAVQRGSTRGPLVSEASLREAAVAAGRYLVRQQRGGGRFRYRYDPLQNTDTSNRQYSIPRHAGTAYALALLHRRTGMPEFARASLRANEWLDRRLRRDCGAAGATCLVSGSTASLGATSLAAIALLEYQRATDDARFSGSASEIMRFIRGMQAADGSFSHDLDTAIGTHGAGQHMFESEEAALALVMAHEVLGDAEDLHAAKRALDQLTGPKYGFFMGQFIYGADHWTCVAAEEAWPRLDDVAYLDFCEGYSAFVGRGQYDDSWVNADFAGHYGLGALMPPQAPAAAGFTEAVVSTYELGVHHGRPNAAVRTQALAGLQALVHDQVRPENSWLMPNPKAADGAIRRSLVEPEVRLDFPQHASSALIRGADVAGVPRIP